MNFLSLIPGLIKYGTFVYGISQDIVALMIVAEGKFPEGGKGLAKLTYVREELQKLNVFAAQNAVKFEEIWPFVSKVIGYSVSSGMFNTPAK